MAINLPVLSNEDINRGKNKKAVDKAIPFVLETVITFGCRKNEDESYLEYYNRRPEKLWEDNKVEWEKEVDEELKKVNMDKWPEENKKEEREKRVRKMKETKLKMLLTEEKWTKEEKELIDKKNCDAMDATVLHKLIPTICNGVGRHNPNAPSSTQIDKFLKEVKDIRNDICHDPKGASISGTILDKLEVSAVKVFTACGDLYAPSIDKQTVQKKIDELKKMLLEIKDEVMTRKQRRILQTAKKMSEDGMAELHAAALLQATDFLPISEEKVSRSDVFHSVDLLIKHDQEDDTKVAGTINGKNKRTHREMPCHELFDHFQGDNILCEGPPGTGKTTLLKMLREDFGAQSTERFRGVRKFDLLLHMECRNKSVTTINQLLEQHFPKTLQQLKRKEAVEALLQLNLLICVDGLDELTVHTKKLLRELISRFGRNGNTTFIFTSRPGQARSVSLSFQTVTLQSITEEKEQIKFLKRYEASIRGLEGSGLIKAFLSLNETCKAVLRQPVYLTMFCALFRESPEIIKQWKNEIKLMNDFLRLSKQTMIDRLESMDLENTVCLAEDVTAAVLDLSLCLLQLQEVSVNAKTYSAMCREIFGETKVAYYSIFSSFFTNHPDQQTFEFFHKSNMEFLAAKAIVERLCINPTVGVFGTITTILKERSRWIPYLHDATTSSPQGSEGKDGSVRRFQNVFRFIVMILVDGGPAMAGILKRFLKEVCPALVQEDVQYGYWVGLVHSCGDNEEVTAAAAKAAMTVSTESWTVTNDQEMNSVSRMLNYHQPDQLIIEPLPSEERSNPVKTLLKAVAEKHMGTFELHLKESFHRFTECNELFHCLESAKCQLVEFTGCLSGSDKKAWRGLVEATKRAQQQTEETPWLSISLRHPRQHKLGELERTVHLIETRVQLPSNPADRCRRPLPTHLLSVDCRPAAGGEAPSDEETTAGLAVALIEDLAPKSMTYFQLFLHHYSGTDSALDRMVTQLRASGVRTACRDTTNWEEKSRYQDGRCTACFESSHGPAERCLELFVCDENQQGSIFRYSATITNKDGERIFI